MLKKKVVGNV